MPNKGLSSENSLIGNKRKNDSREVSTYPLPRPRGHPTTDLLKVQMIYLVLNIHWTMVLYWRHVAFQVALTIDLMSTILAISQTQMRPNAASQHAKG